jgi:hypothetical protein
LELFFKNVGYEHQNFFENRDDILKKIDWCWRHWQISTS